MSQTEFRSYMDAHVPIQLIKDAIQFRILRSFGGWWIDGDVFWLGGNLEELHGHSCFSISQRGKHKDPIIRDLEDQISKNLVRVRDGRKGLWGPNAKKTQAVPQQPRPCPGIRQGYKGCVSHC
eukprot:7794925-Lingulodinium_polyedra.AAC.2